MMKISPYVFDCFNRQNMDNYHDVLPLPEVFENFPNVCLKAYNLDPCHFYTSPGLAWQACLKMTNVEHDLSAGAILCLGKPLKI